MKINRSSVGTFPCDKFSGSVLDFLPTGTAWLKSEVYATSIHIKSGASGGPVMRGIHVVGVNSSSNDTLVDSPPTSFVTPISLLFEMTLVEGDGSRITVKELIEDGIIILND